MASDHKDKAAEHEEKSKRKKIERKLDEALEDSFPGSEPASISQPKPSKHDKGPA